MPKRQSVDRASSSPSGTAELPDLFTSSPVSWRGVDPGVLLACVDAASAQGHAVLFSKSGDGGTLVCTFYMGGARPVKYFQHCEDATAFLREFTEYLMGNASR